MDYLGGLICNHKCPCKSEADLTQRKSCERSKGKQPGREDATPLDLKMKEKTIIQRSCSRSCKRQRNTLSSRASRGSTALRNPGSSPVKLLLDLLLLQEL